MKPSAAWHANFPSTPPAACALEGQEVQSRDLKNLAALSPAVRLSLVVCTVGRVEVLHRLLTSLSRQTSPAFEVVLVDQNPGDELASVVARYGACLGLRHVRSEPGLSRARNVGIGHAVGAVVGFPDDDCWYAPGTVEAVMAEFDADDRLDVLNGRTVDGDGRESLNTYAMRPTCITKRNIWETHNSNALFFRKAALAATGGFDETLGVGAATRFQSGEEVDLILRAIELGHDVRYKPELSVFHDQVTSVFSAVQLDRSRRYAPGFGRILRKHRYGPAYLAYRLARTSLGCGLALARGDLWKVRYKVAWACGTLSGFMAKIG